MLPRMVESRLRDALADTPVVVVQGPRQCGKSTLVQSLRHGPYVTLDDSLDRSAAHLTPASFLSSRGPKVVIDEVQREPGLFREIKKLVDRDRAPGRFLLTGSANILLVPRLSESLAGRMEVVPLWPLSQAEKRGDQEALADSLFAGHLPSVQPTPYDIAEAIQTGGFPEPVSRSVAHRRRAWFQSYIRALIERDIRDLAEIDGAAHLPRLLDALARRPYEVLNVSALARETGVPNTTLTRYISLLKGVFLLHGIPAWTTTDAKAAKTERLAFVDCGVWSYLQPERPLAALDMFAAMELVKQATWSKEEYEVMHFRSVRQHSVPIVLRRPDGGVVGVHVIDRPEPEPNDFRALEFFAEVAGSAFQMGVVMHTGTRCGPVSERLFSAPLAFV